MRDLPGRKGPEGGGGIPQPGAPDGRQRHQDHVVCGDLAAVPGRGAENRRVAGVHAPALPPQFGELPGKILYRRAARRADRRALRRREPDAGGGDQGGHPGGAGGLREFPAVPADAPDAQPPAGLQKLQHHPEQPAAQIHRAGQRPPPITSTRSPPALRWRSRPWAASRRASGCGCGWCGNTAAMCRNTPCGSTAL